MAVGSTAILLEYCHCPLVGFLMGNAWCGRWQVVAEALSNAGVQEGDLSAVAVTIGPGLSMCLRGCLQLHLLYAL